MSKTPENNKDDLNKFSLPEDYFLRSANSIFSRINWIEEHKEFPKLSELKNSVNPNGGFVVPGEYFNNSESGIELIAYSKLPHLKNSGSGFIVPANYFEETEVNELSKVLSGNNDEPQLFLGLNSIARENHFVVPDGYFEDSEQRLLAANHKSARVIGLFNRKFFFSAAAAIFAIVLGLWIYNQYFKTAKVNDCGSLACLDKNDLVKAKHLENMDNDELYELVNTNKLKENLENKTTKKIAKKDSSDKLKNVSTDELLDEI